MAGTVLRRKAETGPGVWAGGSLRVPIRRRLKRLRAVREVEHLERIGTLIFRQEFLHGCFGIPMEAHALYVGGGPGAIPTPPEPCAVQRPVGEALALAAVRASPASNPRPDRSGPGRPGSPGAPSHIVFRGGSAQERMA